MTLSRIKETFLRLPRHIKLIGAGSLILGISTLLPWYADLDSYKIGDQFLGITGPASFVGIVILLLSVGSLWLFSYRLLERKVPRLPVREPIFHLFVGIESVFLLLIVNSIFFHPKFGVNITLKESRFGMTLAIIGAVILVIGAYFQNKKEIEEAKSEGKLEPLIKMEQPQHVSPHIPERPVTRPAPTYYQRYHSPLVKHEHEPHRISPHAKEGTKGFLFGETASAPAASAPVKTEQASQPAQTSQKPPESTEMF
ncbi:hypothetical protein HZC21_01890 [Candidatus Peregrinibacteria bacterium]|nr:hypothetical protein [Candidatus Peregrinibacteria bacterium]